MDRTIDPSSAGTIIAFGVVVLLPAFIGHKVHYMLTNEDEIWDDEDWQFKYQNVVFPFKRDYAYAFTAIRSWPKTI